MSYEDTVCPHCQADLAPNPPYSRTILVEVRGVYDGGLYYQCPDCDGVWHRWTGADEYSLRLRNEAEALWARWDEQRETKAHHYE